MEYSHVESEINLPTLALLPNSTKALREHRARHLCVFERVIRKKNSLIRYYSDEPSICVGEWVLEQFTPPENDWLILAPMAQNASELNWYALHVTNGHVYQEHIAPLPELAKKFALELAQSERVYTPQLDNLHEVFTDADIHLDDENKGGCPQINLTSANLKSLPRKYKTNAVRRLKPSILIFLAAITLTVTGLIVHEVTKPAPKPIGKVHVDPLATWFTELNQTPLASPALTKAQSLLTRARLLPADYKPALLTIQDMGMTLKIADNISPPNRLTLKEWLLNNAGDGNWSSESEQLTVTAPLAPQSMQTVSIKGMPDALYTQLRLLGAAALTVTQSPSIGEVESWSVAGKFNNVSIMMLSHIADITQTKPIFIKNMTITPHDNAQIDATFTLLLLGRIQHEL